LGKITRSKSSTLGCPSVQECRLRRLVELARRTERDYCVPLYKSGLLNKVDCCYASGKGQQLIAELLLKAGLKPSN
jgi:hypothetical protein